MYMFFTVISFEYTTIVICMQNFNDFVDIYFCEIGFLEYNVLHIK